MQQRQLGKTDMRLTTVGLGTWAMGGPWQYGWGPQDDDEAVASILEALDQGINWIDTAPAYGLGHSEELVGQALRRTKHKPYVATKCGILWNDKKEKVVHLKRDSIRRECHDSLRRLGVETIDLYQMHWPDPDPDIEDAWEEMARLAKEGKVRYLGVSNFSVQQMERVAKIHPIASLQPPYSMLHREVERELLGYCAQHGIGVVVYSPMQRGLLTGTFSRERLATLAPDDHRRRMPEFQDPQLGATLELVEGLKEIARRNGKTVSQLAVAWVLRRGEVTAAIVGARRPGQIAETATASDWNLGKRDVEEVEKLLAARDKKLADGI
ncbi:MAG TPA: aldo/keto reductase [Sedimentisphaerales bacterium]|jgi:aryl-alcohol dehydrogenase-like predicted oxidoreductase|nr:aldo/keto reductase [Sedimentisphaerales bacterium]HNU31240.1 aldo/keto reductase [Sedimentisphaerales bacterium]